MHYLVVDPELCSSLVRYVIEDTPPSKKTKNKSDTLSQECTLCSKQVTKDALECGWCECLQHSACLEMSADQCGVLDSMSGNVIFFVLHV